MRRLTLRFHFGNRAEVEALEAIGATQAQFQKAVATYQNNKDIEAIVMGMQVPYLCTSLCLIVGIIVLVDNSYVASVLLFCFRGAPMRSYRNMDSSSHNFPILCCELTSLMHQ